MDTISSQKKVGQQLFNPFPGLRPFHPEEAHLFFGRDGQSEEILENLSKNKFAGILGASGSGKSSLIYCGLLPILYGGFLHNGRSKWRVSITRPGLAPTDNLAKSIAETFTDSKEKTDIDTDSLINQALLNRSSDGIQNLINQYGIKNDENVLILVDQFEELFRYQYSEKDSDALDKVDHFINLLVSAVKQQELPIYIVITMRSDFIGDCSPFQQLTRLINDSHYLIPRMTRNDFRKAITGPIAVAGGQISDQLVQLLLNEMGNNPDHLPVLQHALMRTWDYWVNNSNTNMPMGITEYEAIGRLELALSNHANDAYYELTVDQKRTCEIILKSLTEKGADNRGIRRPTPVWELAQIAETTSAEVISVVEVFRRGDRTFLTPPPNIELNENSLIDISHESLMRVWDKLKIWVEDEANAVKMYLRLAESAELYSEGKANLWGPPDLQLALTWREKQKPNLPWATRYHPAFERTMVYLKTSEEEYIAEEENKIRLQKRALRRSRIVALILGTAGMISIGLGILALIQRQDAIQASNRAIEQEQIAINQAELAEQQRILAEESEKEAREQRDQAEENRKQAEEQRLIAQRNLNEADRQQRIATQREKEAQDQRIIAELNEKLAIEQQELAEQASRDAERRRMLSIAQSMAVRSEQMRTDTMLKGILAHQAYHFNEIFEGSNFNPDIFKALYSGLSFFKGEGYNVYPNHTSMVRTILEVDNNYFTAGSDGQISQLTSNWESQLGIVKNLGIIKRITNHNNSLYGATNNGILEYDLKTKETNFFNYSNPEIKNLFINQNGQFIIVSDKSVSISDGFGKAPKQIFTSDATINASLYIPNSEVILLAFNNGEISVLNKKESGEFSSSRFASIPESNWGEIGYNPKRNILAGGFGNNQGAVYLWNYQTGSLLSVLRGHKAKITGVAFSSQGNLMATSSYDGTVRLWNLDDLNILPVVFDDHESWVTAIDFSRDGSYVISGGRNGKVMAFPTIVNSMVKEYCDHLTRSFTPEEWSSYVGEDIPFNPTKCND
ncbi:MAG: hypothetical protein ACLFNU_03175 [Bacteroidales bacterium]